MSFGKKIAKTGEKDFKCRVPNIPHFSSTSYFKTIFAGDGDKNTELSQVKLKEAAEFKKKMVVDSMEFQVNKMVKNSHIFDKYRSMLEDPAVKKGLRLSRSKLKTLQDRDIKATRQLSPMPVC